MSVRGYKNAGLAPLGISRQIELMGAQLRFFFDYVDPLSYRVQRLLIRRGLDGVSHLTYHPYELNPPPAPLFDPGGPNWHGRWEPAVK